MTTFRSTRKRFPTARDTTWIATGDTAWARHDFFLCSFIRAWTAATAQDGIYIFRCTAPSFSVLLTTALASSHGFQIEHRRGIVGRSTPRPRVRHRAEDIGRIYQWSQATEQRQPRFGILLEPTSLRYAVPQCSRRRG